MSAVILGCGPAGTAAALTLLDAGLPVTMVERDPFPRYRPGETLHPGIAPLLAKLGVGAGALAAGGIRHPGVWSAWGEPARFVPYGEDNDGPWRGYQLMRSDFDCRMREQAQRRGADIVDAQASGVVWNSAGDVAGLLTSRGSIPARVVIDASGSRHQLARWLGIRMVRHAPRLVARYGYVDGACASPEPLISSDADGWTWVAQVAPGRFQWTRVTTPDRRPTSGWRPHALHGSDFGPRRGSDVTWRMADILAGRGWFLAGDAAAVLDPCTSHGVLRAVMSGMMAGYLIIRHLHDHADQGACASTYHQWFTSWFEHDMKTMAQAYGQVNLFGFGC